LIASGSAPVLAQDKGLTVFAAGSMKNALDDIEPPITAKTGVGITVSYAGKFGACQTNRARRALRRVYLRDTTGWNT